MKNKNLFILSLIVSLSPIGNGLHYFISGEPYRNSDLRNYAVVGQIIFGLAILAYTFWDQKKSFKKSNG